MVSRTSPCSASSCSSRSEVAFKRVDERLAGWLLDEVSSTDVVHTTHERLAQHLGTAREVVPFHEVKDEGGMVQEGALRMVAVMERKASAKDTGGWSWAAFDGQGKAMAIDAKTACFTCHVPKQDRSYVFSEWR